MLSFKEYLQESSSVDFKSLSSKDQTVYKRKLDDLLDKTKDGTSLSKRDKDAVLDLKSKLNKNKLSRMDLGKLEGLHKRNTK